MELQKLKRIEALKINKLEERFEEAIWQLENHNKMTNVVESMLERFEDNNYNYETLESWTRFLEKKVEQAEDEERQPKPIIYDYEPYGETHIQRPIDF